MTQRLTYLKPQAIMNTHTNRCTPTPAFFYTIITAPELALVVTGNLTSLSSIWAPPQDNPTLEVAASHCIQQQKQSTKQDSQ